MARVRLIHGHPGEGEARAAQLRGFGHEVVFEPARDVRDLRRYGQEPPDLFVLDLARQPSRVRDIAVALRGRRSTRYVPLVFIGGEAPQVRRVRTLLPDANFCSFRGLRGAIARAMCTPPADPVAPGALAGYSGTPLPRKLGIKAGSRLVLLGAPPDFEALLGPLPEGVRITRRAGGAADLVIVFAQRAAELRRRLDGAVRTTGTQGRLWLAWPKKSSGLQTDLGEREIRALGLATGLVDFKICAIDATWSGLCFGQRRRT